MKTFLISIVFALISLQVFSQQQFQLLIHPGLKQEARYMNEVAGGGYLLASNFTDTSGKNQSC